jgi:hypothetical protein
VFHFLVAWFLKSLRFLDMEASNPTITHLLSLSSSSPSFQTLFEEQSNTPQERPLKKRKIGNEENLLGLCSRFLENGWKLIDSALLSQPVQKSVLKRGNRKSSSNFIEIYSTCSLEYFGNCSESKSFIQSIISFKETLLTQNGNNGTIDLVFWIGTHCLASIFRTVIHQKHHHH